VRSLFRNGLTPIKSKTALGLAEASPRTFRFDWREFAILTVAGTVGAILVVPYIVTLQGPTLRRVHLPLPLPILLSIQMAQSAIFIALLVALGLFVARRCGLGAPVLESWLAGATLPSNLLKTFALAAAAGVGICLLILGLDAWLFVRYLPRIATSTIINPPAWQGFLASFYGGITEELLLRLGIMSFLVWLLAKVWHDEKRLPRTPAFWAANIVSAVLFGLGHLPATAALMPLTKLVVLRAVVLNGLPGVVFGWLYWKRGLESAMVAHFAGDLVLHVMTPLVGRA
jgi:membrane protease YdiL (CAAX protease family)